jgi:condensin complex subunit 2
MPPARQGQSPNTSKSLYADESDEEFEPETPRPQKTHLRKRLSEAQIPDNDPSLTSDNAHVRINDDAAEKRRRRKSTKVHPEGSLEQETAGSKTGRQEQLNSVAAPEINVSLDIMSSNFEEWMKMATDNVRSEALFLFLSLIVLIENQCSELVEFRTYRLFSRHVSVEE